MTEEIKKKVDESWKEKAKIEENKEGSQDEKQAMPKPDFSFFLTSLAMQAWIGLGAIQNPATQKTEKNIDQAKFIIDTLEMLEGKTKGNLSKEEMEFLEHVLYELRLAYVNLSAEKK